MNHTNDLFTRICMAESVEDMRAIAREVAGLSTETTATLTLETQCLP